jgi:hypothetical protein
MLVDSSDAANDDTERTDELCERSLAILADASERFATGDARVLFADAYLSVGDSFQKANRPEYALKAWNLARDKLGAFTDEEVPLSAGDINERIRSVDDRLQKAASADSQY